MGLDLSKYDERIIAKIQDIETNRVNDPKHVIEVCKELEQEATRKWDMQLKAYALYSNAHACYFINDTEVAIRRYTESIFALKVAENWELLSRSYSELGILCSAKGNNTLAMDYYLQGLAVCEEHEIMTVHVFITVNIGVLYLSFHDLYNAQKHFEKAERVLRQIYEKNNNDYEPDLAPDQVSTVYLNLANCYFRTNQIEKALAAIDKATELEKMGPEPSLYYGILMLKAEMYHAIGRVGESDALIEEIDHDGMYMDVIMDCFDDLFEYANFLLAHEKENEFLNLIKALDETVREAQSVFLNRKVTELKIHYYKSHNNNKEYMLATGLYYELSMQMEMEQEKTYAENLTTRLDLEKEKRERLEAEREAASFRSRSERDGLTGLYNRAKINELSETKFSACQKNGQYFALEIVDIDAFKQFNDNYGHQGGDDVIKTVAGTLLRLERHSGVYVGRYGGDEFLVIYSGHSAEDVNEYAKEIKESLDGLNIIHEYSPYGDHVTVSQGLYVSRPVDGDSLFDFMYRADRALYKVKDSGKNNFCVLTDKDEF